VAHDLVVVAADLRAAGSLVEAGKEPTMKIAVVGRGNVGGGLANLWEKAGHEIVARIGSEGGEVAGADVVLVAVPGGAIADALDRVQGIGGKTVIDATNLVGAEPPSGFESNAEFVKAKTNGPTEVVQPQFCESARKAWPGEIAAEQLLVGRRRGACPVVEQLNRDAGYEPVRLGGLDKAAIQEHGTDIWFAVAREMGPFFYRFAPPEQL
jgi:predicted dinucleotide-binding enzyme